MHSSSIIFVAFGHEHEGVLSMNIYPWLVLFQNFLVKAIDSKQTKQHE